MYTVASRLIDERPALAELSLVVVTGGGEVGRDGGVRGAGSKRR